MKKIITSLFIFGIILLPACNNTDNPTPDVPGPAGISKQLSETLNERVPQDNEFAFDIFRRTVESTDKTNVFVSPLSVSTALGMTWNGARENTKTEMETALKMSGLTQDEINEYYQYMINTLPTIDPKTKLSIANSIWYRTGYPVKADFLEINSTYFNAEVRELDFSRPDAVDIINGWCSEKTNGLIKEPLDDVPGDAIMYLINAIYFKGLWAVPFNKGATMEEYFYAEDGNETIVDMMRQIETFDYAEDEYAQYVDLPYGDGSYSMTVMLPKKDKTVNDLLGYLSVDIWNKRVKELSATEIYLSVPRFKAECRYILNDILKAMGMKAAFGAANLTGIANASLVISRVIHSTFVEVNEEGTEAAAVTIVEVKETSGPQEPPIPSFTANRPFVYAIREHSTGAILFMGKMGKIEKE